MLICVWGEASGVSGCGEIVSLVLDAEAPAGAASMAMASPAIRYLLLGFIARKARRLRPATAPQYCGK